jgi:hypothetical protein
MTFWFLFLIKLLATKKCKLASSNQIELKGSLSAAVQLSRLQEFSDFVSL